MCGLNCHLLSCKFSGVPRSLPKWSTGPLAFTHRHGQSDGMHWPHLLCIRGRKTLSLGNYFLFIELTSQLHRTLVPIPVWLFYLLDHNDRIPAKVLGVILTAAYMVFKGKSILKTALAWKTAASKLMQSTRYGLSPSHDELKATGGTCPICHDLSDPTKLHCKHIFCEECVTIWFDREKTCPMCRAQVTEDPSWRDGSTSQFVQLF